MSSVFIPFLHHFALLLHTQSPRAPTLKTCEQHFNTNWLFATNFVEEFISEVVEEELGRSVVRETLSETSSWPTQVLMLHM